MNNKELREKAIKKVNLLRRSISLDKIRALFINSLSILYVIEKLNEN